MVHNNYKWNMSKKNGKNLILNEIEKILLEKKNNSSDLNELIYLLNNRNKNVFQKNNKNKNLLNFIKNNFISFEYFIKNESNFILIDNQIQLNQINDVFCKNKYNDWVFIE